jgi:hypothetical protein
VVFYVYLLYGLFNDVVSASNCKALKDKLVKE